MRWDAGMVMCLGQGADLHMAQLMPLPLTISCSSKSRLVLPSWCWLTWVVQDKIQGRKMVVCSCVCVCTSSFLDPPTYSRAKECCTLVPFIHYISPITRYKNCSSISNSHTALSVRCRQNENRTHREHRNCSCQASRQLCRHTHEPTEICSAHIAQICPLQSDMH